MIIILEGCNKGGKTTLVNKIKEFNPNKNFELIKCSQPKDGDAYKEYSNILDKVENNKDKNYIIDRFHFGSYVYGPIYRGKPDFNLEKFVEIESRIIELDYIFILALPFSSFMRKKFKEDNEDFAKVELINKEKYLFNETKKMSRLMILEHKLPNHDITDKIKNYINMYV